ncbi:MAG: hypothetical protein V1859_06275 [archaeon]
MSDYSSKALTIAINYLGPAAGTFLERQTMYHMKGLVFTSLEKKHIPEFAKWVRISAGLIIDPAKAKELSEKIAALDYF